jgi:hypothetical protein
MLPAFAENNLVTTQLFNSACSRTVQSSVRHVRKYSRAMACSGAAGSFYRCEPNTACGWQNDRGAQNAKRPWGPEEDKQSDQRDQVGVRPGPNLVAAVNFLKELKAKATK